MFSRVRSGRAYKFAYEFIIPEKLGFVNLFFVTVLLRFLRKVHTSGAYLFRFWEK